MGTVKKPPVKGWSAFFRFLLTIGLIGLALFCILGLDRSLNERLLLSWFVVLIDAICIRMPHRKTYVEAYGWTKETIKKDIVRKLSVTGLDVILLPPAVLYFVAAWVFSVDNTRGNVVDKFVAITAVLGFIGLIIKFIRFRKVRKGAITVRWDTVDSKSVNTEGDGPNTYSITYKNEESYWSRQVTQAEYDCAAEGDIIRVAYLDGEKSPILISNHYGVRKSVR